MSENSHTKQNEETPMEVDSTAPEMDGDRSSETSSIFKENAPFASENGSTTNKNAPFSGYSSTTKSTVFSGTSSSEARIEETDSQQDLYTAEDSWTRVQADVDWPKEMESGQTVELQKFYLKRAVEHLLSKHMNKAECRWQVFEIEHPIFWVKPRSAMDKLCQEKYWYLDLNCWNGKVKVHFSPVPIVPSSPSAPPQSPVTVQPLNQLWPPLTPTPSIPKMLSMSVKNTDYESMSRKTSSIAKGNAFAASGNSPMTNEFAFSSGNRPTTNKNAVFSGNGPNESAVTASADAQKEETGSLEDPHAAEGSWARVEAEVDWPMEIAESKRKVELQKAVQSLLNNMNADEQNQMDKLECKVEVLYNEHFALLSVKPPSVMDKLCQEKYLKFKSCNVTANVCFSPAPSAPPQSPVANREGNKKTFSRSFSANSAQNSAFSQRDTQVEKETLTVPLFHYWHITTACSKEIAQIQRSNRVNIEEQALVSIMAPAREEGKRAKEDFTSLVQKCAQDIHFIPVSITSPDQRNVMEMLKEIQKEDCKLVLSVSSNGCQLSGSKESLDKFQRKWRLESCQRDSEEVLHKKDLEMDLQDPLEKQGLSMNSFHWEFISKVFEKQVMAIKEKFGVDFDVKPASGVTNVKAVPASDQKFRLACHALRALEQLYQKGVTNILVCPLKYSIHSKVDHVQSAFDEVRSRHPYVAAGEVNGPWKLVGLAEHLWPAVEEVERLVGEPVFSEEAKMQLQRPKSSPTVSGGAAAGQAGVAEDENCPICLDTFTDKKKLKCTHEFCRDCLKQAVENMGPCCPVCKDFFGKMEGNQPDGTMVFRKVKYIRLPGFDDCGAIEIEYRIPDGTQTKKHPNPGKPFRGDRRTAYLPDNKEGNEVLMLLKRAFDQRLIFTVGTSSTTGANNTITWNDIHHKTNTSGGPQGFGYPDDNYLKRVKEELKAKGIE